MFLSTGPSPPDKKRYILDKESVKCFEISLRMFYFVTNNAFGILVGWLSVSIPGENNNKSICVSEMGGLIVKTFISDVSNVG